MRFLLSAIAICITSAVWAGDGSTIRVDSPVIFKAFDKARAAGGYMNVTNTGAEDDLLVGVEIAGHMAMIHESREENGVMRMLHVDAIAVPSEGEVRFSPGGFHIMIMGLGPDDLPVGDRVEATLVFDRAGEVPVTFTVADRSALGMTN